MLRRVRNSCRAHTLPPAAVGASETVPRPPGQVTAAAGGPGRRPVLSQEEDVGWESSPEVHKPPSCKLVLQPLAGLPHPSSLGTPGPEAWHLEASPALLLSWPAITWPCPTSSWRTHLALKLQPPTVSRVHQGARLTEVVGHQTAAADGAQPMDQDLTRWLSAALSPPSVPAAGSLPLTLVAEAPP